MEPECSLPCSQEPATGPYPEQMNPVHTFPNLSRIHSNVIPHFEFRALTGLQNDRMNVRNMKRSGRGLF
jgi:hypothetical protein